MEQLQILLNNPKLDIKLFVDLAVFTSSLAYVPPKIVLHNKCQNKNNFCEHFSANHRKSSEVNKQYHVKS